MKLRFKYNRNLYGWAGIVLYPFVLFSRKKEHVSDKLFRHELEHVYQVRKMGWWRFYLTYLYEMARYDHEDRSLEIMANAMENVPLTLVEQMLKKDS